MPFTTIKPENWPQEKLRIPDGMGGMPPLDYGNRTVTGSEFFCLSGRIQITALLPAQSQRRIILETPQDGDFWCEQIAAVSWATNAVVDPDHNIQQFLASMVSIKDIRTGRSLVLNRGIQVGAGANLIPIDSVPLNLFRTLPQSGTEVGVSYDGSTPAPSGFRSKGTLIQPFCFTRQGGIEVILTTLYDAPANYTFDVSIGFIGWKEYANASR